MAHDRTPTDQIRLPRPAELFRAVDSVDSLKLAEKLDAAARNLGRKLDVLVEINVGGEEAKSGYGAGFTELKSCCSRRPSRSTCVSRTNDRASVHRRS